jgi:polysaccharide biosynthesis/export protein
VTKTLRMAAGLIAMLVLPLPMGAQDRPQDPAPPAQAQVGEPESWTPWSGRYRITPSDVLELTFPQVPEFDQTLMVQPDGYITLRAAGEIRVQGRTLPELQQQLYEAYEPILRDPSITIVLKEFEKPFFTIAGEVKTPGKFELRGALTLTQALAVAGGFTGEAKSSQVVLFRRFSADLLEVKQIDVGAMYSRRNLDEDHLIRPGDTILVPRSLFSRLAPFIPVPGIGMYLNPLR